MTSTTEYFKLIKREEELNRELFSVKIKKVEMAKKVWKECIHDWTRCSDYDDGDLCKYVCKKCTLYNNPYIYN